MDGYIKCGKIKIDTNTYQLVIGADYVRDYFRLSIDNNGKEVYKEISYEERKKLDIIFTKNIGWFLYSQKNDKNNKVDKVVVISGIVIAISIYNIISMTAAYVLCKNNPYSSRRLNSNFIRSYSAKTFFTDAREQLFNIDYDTMSIGQIIKNNMDIPDKYEDDIYEIYNIICSKLPNQQFINIKPNLYNLKIKNKVNTNSQLNMEGSYSNLYDCITIYRGENLENNRSTLAHEFLHLLSSRYDKKNKAFHSGFTMISKSASVGYGLTEGMTEFLNENLLGYCGDNTFAYSYYAERSCVKMLCEIIGTEKMVEAYFNNDLELLIDELTEIYGTKEDAIKLITTIDSLHIVVLYEKEKIETSGIVDEVLTQFLKYYYAKTSRDIENGVYTRDDKYEFNVTTDYFKDLFFSIGKGKDNRLAFNMMRNELLTEYDEKNNTAYRPIPLEYNQNIITKDYFYEDGERFVIKTTDYLLDSNSFKELDESTTRYNYIYVNRDNNAVKTGGK